MRLRAFGRGRCSEWGDDTLRFDRGRERRGGGAVFAGRSDLKVTGHWFFLNGPVKDGGGMYLYDCHRVEITDCVFVLNLAKWGGAIYLERCSDVLIQGNIFVANLARRDGGAVSVSFSRRVTLSRNRTAFNAALRRDHRYDLHKCSNVMVE